MRRETRLETLKAACAIALRMDQTAERLREVIATSERGAIDRAIKQARTLLETNPRCAEASVIEGSLRLHGKSQRVAAMRAFSSALEKNPSNSLTLWYLALDAAARGEALEVGLPFLQEAARSEPPDSFAWITYAWLARILGQPRIAALTPVPGRSADARDLVCEAMEEVLSSVIDFRTAEQRPGAQACFARLGSRCTGEASALACWVDLMTSLCGRGQLGREAVILGSKEESSDRAASRVPRCAHLLNPALEVYGRRFGRVVTSEYTAEFLRLIARPLIDGLMRSTMSTEQIATILHLPALTGVPPDMVEVPAGRYQTSFVNLPGPRHQLGPTLERFFIDRYPVTNLQWRVFRPDHRFAPDQEKHPVVNVDFVQATLYARWKGKRLPTEAEWQAAAQGPEGRPFPWGDRPDPARANCRERKLGTTTAVTAHPTGASAFGALDMMGNVMEWVETPVIGPEGATVQRIAKGAGFNEQAAALQCSARTAVLPSTRSPQLGFRCALDATDYALLLARRKPVEAVSERQGMSPSLEGFRCLGSLV